MNISSKWNFRSIVGKITLGLVLAVLIGSVNVAPSFADDDHGRGERHDNGRYENRGRGYERDRYERHRYERHRHERYRREYRPYGYRERVYVEPPVVYVPPPQPGISIFFPPLFFRP